MSSITFRKANSTKYIVLFDLILYVPSTIFQLNRDGSSWVKPVLSYYRINVSVSSFLSALLEWGFLKSSFEEGRHSYLKYDRLMVDDQEYAYDYDNARPMLARKYDICQGSETIEYRTRFLASHFWLHPQQFSKLCWNIFFSCVLCNSKFV